MIGLPSTQMLNLALGTLYSRFVDRDVNNFEDFHIAILDIFNTFNESLPGKHYDAPTRKEIEECFAEWDGAKESERKKVFIEFMKKKVKLSKLDDATMIAGLVTPPAAMAAKRAGESVPQLRIIKSIPDVVFVPSATVLALVSVKLSRRIFLGNVASTS
ncbi:hypothetical protein RHMOL_Rhmol01G0196400 [Rhododendron molle]|uniref:Uncharacterized protein n=1 Tax=Rhododendron molle TaxID=49168 RepID=A0ACC0Q3U2_RHOML|nr:hypothetical protein RHMOL_Rhmol01G0196400 [Rhododendron molle]